jgi:hypothetical protein
MPQLSLNANQNLNLEINRHQRRFVVCEHPSAPNMPHSMEGGKAFVYHLRELGSSDEHALKVLKSKFVTPTMAQICANLDALKDRPGLSVCHRTCLSPTTAANSLQQFPKLEFSVLMPWKRGRCWFEILQRREPLDTDTALALAALLADVLGQLEILGMAHCDISAGNVVVDVDQRRIELIDVEDMFAANWPPPTHLPAGTPGYQHVTSGQGQWSPYADRFAGAIILSEMLGWWSDEVRKARNDESYFAPDELQQSGSARLGVLLRAVAAKRPAAARLLQQAWSSATLEGCPSLADWRDACQANPVVWDSLSQRQQPEAPAWSSFDPPGGSPPAVTWDSALPSNLLGSGGTVDWMPAPPTEEAGRVEWTNAAKDPGPGSDHDS